MSDNVNISGVDFGGDLPKWSTEKTQADILKALNSFTKKSKKASSDLEDKIEKFGKDSKKDSEKLQSLIDKGFTKDQAKSYAALESALREHSKSKNSDIDKDKLDKLAVSLRKQTVSGKIYESQKEKAFAKTTKSLNLDSFAPNLMKSASSFNKGALMFAGIFVDVVTKIVKSGFELEKTFATLYSSGFAFNSQLGKSAMYDFQKATIESGMSLADMTKIADTHRKVVGKLGIKAFGELNKSAIAAGENIGMLSGETTENFAQFLENQRMSGNLQLASTSAGVQLYKKSLDSTMSFANALNISREELEKKGAAQYEKIDVKAALSTMSSAAKEQFDLVGKNLLSSSDELGSGVSDLLMKTMRDPNLVKRDPMWAQMAAVAPGLLDTITQAGDMLRGGNYSQADADAMIRKLTSSAANLDAGTLSMVSNIGVVDASFGGIVTTAKALQSSMNDPSKRRENDIQQTYARLMNTFNMIKNGFWTSFGTIFLDDRIQNGLQTLATNLEYLIPKLQVYLMNFALNSLPKIIDGVQSFMNWLDKINGTSSQNTGRGGGNGTNEKGDWAGNLLTSLATTVGGWAISGAKIFMFFKNIASMLPTLSVGLEGAMGALLPILNVSLGKIPVVGWVITAVLGVFEGLLVSIKNGDGFLQTAWTMIVFGIGAVVDSIVSIITLIIDAVTKATSWVRSKLPVWAGGTAGEESKSVGATDSYLEWSKNFKNSITGHGSTTSRGVVNSSEVKKEQPQVNSPTAASANPSQPTAANTNQEMSPQNQSATQPMINNENIESLLQSINDLMQKQLSLLNRISKNTNSSGIY